jgi:hypothetical protein
MAPEGIRREDGRASGRVPETSPAEDVFSGPAGPERGKPFLLNPLFSWHGSCNEGCKGGCRNGVSLNPGDSAMKTAIQRNLKRGTGLALLLATCMTLSSCIIVDRHHRRYHRPYLGAAYGQEVRP